MMFNSFRKDPEHTEDDSKSHALIENIVIKVIPLFFAVVLVYVFLVYGALIALMAMFVSVVAFYLIYHGIRAALQGKKRIKETKEKRRYYPYDKG